jgi:ADP-ribosylglycohydrolase
MDTRTSDRLARAYCSLEGLSVGDAFGDRFFIHPDMEEWMISSRALPAPPWSYTDDTLMALSIVSQLKLFGRIDQRRLAGCFAARYDSSRGYGPAMHGMLGRIVEGEEWSEVSASLFEGQGSFGNGGAMRVAPLGAYFADDLDAVVEQAILSTEVTHAHEEAIAGAIAVAVAAAMAWRHRDGHPDRAGFLDLILPYVPRSEVSGKLRRARDMSPDTSVRFAVSVLGNGVGVSAQDTVPFALWCAGTHLDDYEEAIWLTVSGLGDRDTTCAIAGGVVAMHTGVEGIPREWIDAREPLPELPFA